MRNRIQKSMIFVVTMSLLISYILVTLVIYRQALDIRRSELVQEAEYIRAAIDISGEEYFGTMDKVSKRTRVTWIDKDGKVLYDTGNDPVHIRGMSLRVTSHQLHCEALR